jgi:alpha-tubulin suppressor-like RCC1 family protein
MPNFSGVWNLKEQIQAVAAGTWTGLPLPELYAWGSNNSGQLGDDTIVNKSSPVQVTAAANWLQVSAGGSSSAAIKTDGTLWTWGIDNDGQLGLGTNYVKRSSPVQVGSLTTWAQVSASNGQMAAVTDDNKLYAWGSNGVGQLGDGTVVYKSSPVQIGALTNWSQVSASAHAAAVKTDGTLWTWGFNIFGGLGDNTTANKSSPVQIGALTNWSQVQVGGTHTAAVKTDGTIWAWGSNGAGQLGDGTVVNKSSPVQIGALTTWSQVSASTHTAAVKTDGTIWAWGSNSNGCIGDNTVINKSSPVQIGALTTWSQVSVQNGVHTAAVKTDGTLWSWGGNSSGELGDTSTVNRSSPVQVGALTSWSKVSTGNGHTLSIFQGSSN